MPIQNPMRSSLEQLRHHHCVTVDLMQRQHAGTVGLNVVQVRNDRDIDAVFEQQPRHDILFQLTLGGILARALRYYDGQTHKDCSKSERLIFNNSLPRSRQHGSQLFGHSRSWAPQSSETLPNRIPKSGYGFRLKANTDQTRFFSE